MISFGQQRFERVAVLAAPDTDDGVALPQRRVCWWARYRLVVALDRNDREPSLVADFGARQRLADQRGTRMEFVPLEEDAARGRCERTSLATNASRSLAPTRSEERRVGKECRL